MYCYCDKCVNEKALIFPSTQRSSFWRQVLYLISCTATDSQTCS